ncbi:hypothetical protein QG37_00012 [Candidozyma auris]|uniref:Uncharacterized protein n=1 Tax=Candidozyma auris TaxID=498019 RepID=A0A0L0P9T3_CANAR|nr:hypothetical protein QG37_00012 [[Candida] auris]
MKGEGGLVGKRKREGGFLFFFWKRVQKNLKGFSMDML